ncbi:tetratricopeptide repeat protein [Glycomyces sp. TRM65418]|uniref:tetratricopeptide repeat protein n=1 Tax=Glycomyces sp. TRM65418 TaxID=2867006 RepID=UPI001CE618E7|nr:tetratricopeptide repeat protein [Glycomyces sp. TRM65418]MCC3762347.1 tetratricopeptide repeat protein [Glycomyces sp. TRM65418]QZD56399.1 tetratricopeptide repeat protein [Glycomyces sp. TRM65418]
MATPDPDEIWRLLNEARFEEASEAKVAALERAVEAADAVGDPELTNYALNGLVNAYEFSRDSTRLLVPFARLLRNFDSQPEHFDAYLTRSLYWTFKWIVDKMIEQPDVPLESIEHWLQEMRRRYAEAGYSMHAPAAYEMQLAYHVGDYDRVAAAIEALGEAEEDEMSDCTACQYTSLATIVFYAEEDSADAAMEMLEPVLSGEYTCAHEPHYGLALSLLPLVELGRTDQARANHLRGYQMCKGKEDMIGMITLHVEFCALTGNEHRAVEILADHARFYDLDLGVRDRQRLMEVTVLTCRRLKALGFTDNAMPGPSGADWTAETLHDWAEAERQAICARFDARNGNDHHSAMSECVIDSTPYEQPVHLGLKELKPKRPDEPPVPGPVRGPDLDAAIDAAYAAFDDCSPDTWKAWLKVGALADALGIELIAEHRAEIAHAESAQADDPEQIVAGLRRAVELFNVAGQPGRALVAEAFLLIHSAEAEFAETREGAARIVAAARALRAEQRIDDRSYHTCQVLAMRAEYLAASTAGTLFASPTGPSGPDDASGSRNPSDPSSPSGFGDEEEAGDLSVPSGPHSLDGSGGPAGAGRPDLPADPQTFAADLGERVRALEAELADCAGQRYALIRRCDLIDLRARLEPDPAAKTALLNAGLDVARTSGAGWAIARASADLADQVGLTGDFDRALAITREGLAALGDEPSHTIAAKLHLQAAEFTMRAADHPATYEHALAASIHCDAAGMTVPAAVARHLMGVALVEQDRRAEAVPLLEAALEDLPDQELWRVCNVRFNLAECYDRQGDARQGVEHGLAALALMEAADEDHLVTLYADTLFLTGELLEKLGEHEHALEVYTRAVEAADALGDLTSWTRVSRARAWLLRTIMGDNAFGDGLQTMAQIAARLHAVRADPQAPQGLREAARFELGETYRQHALLTYQFLESQAGEAGLRRDEAEPVLDLQRRALVVFREGTLLLERASLTAHQTMWLLSELGDTQGAIEIGEDALTWLAAPEHTEAREGFEQHLADLRQSAAES